MSYSSQRVTSDGTLSLLPISIEYFDRTEISVLFDGVVSTTGWTWVGDTDKTITFSPAVPIGVEVMVLRTTDLADTRHIFSLGAAFKAANVDEDFKQILHIAQEARENASISDIYQDLNMHGYKVVNVGAGTDPLDLVNQTQLTANNATVQGYVYDAEDFAEASEASALRSEAAALVAEVIGDMATQVHAAAEKTTPVNDDEFGLVDSAASNVLKRFKWSSLVTALNSLYAPTGYTTSGTSTAFTLTPSPAISANAEFKRFNLKFHTAPGDNPTLAISGQTALPIVYETSTGTYVAIVTGDVPSGWRTDAICTGTQYVITVPEARISQFTSSLATNGYQKLPSGLIIQWGNLATSAAGSYVVTLPLAFSTANLQVLSTNADSGTSIGGTTVTAKTVSNFTVYKGSGVYVTWLAIGY